MPSAGALIDRAGLKGFTIGAAAVSGVHANYLVSKGNTTRASRDMKELISVVRRRVLAETGVDLAPEIRLVPYSENEEASPRCDD